MKQRIDLFPYTEAVIKEVLPNGDLLCDVYGENVFDCDIVLPKECNVLIDNDQEGVKIEKPSKPSGEATIQ